MSLTNLSTGELQDLLMEETKKLTTAIREAYPREDRDDLRKRIQEIQRLLELRKEKDDKENDATLRENI